MRKKKIKIKTILIIIILIFIGPVVAKSPAKIENLEHTDLTQNAEKVQESIDSVKSTPRKFGQNVEAPHSPVSTTASSKIETASIGIMEKQENIVTGEEDEEIVFKVRIFSLLLCLFLLLRTLFILLFDCLKSYHLLFLGTCQII